MDTNLTASVATFRVFSSRHRPSTAPGNSSTSHASPPSIDDRMAATPVTEGPLILSTLASNEINYLQVNNFTRAVMPRSTIWRVSSNELVIPASFTNYWLITLQGPQEFIAELDHILRSLCKYAIVNADENGDHSGSPLREAYKHRVSPQPKTKSALVANAEHTISQGKISSRLTSTKGKGSIRPEAPKSAPTGPISSLRTPDSSCDESAVVHSDVETENKDLLATPPSTPPPGARGQREQKDFELDDGPIAYFKRSTPLKFNGIQNHESMSIHATVAQLAEESNADILPDEQSLPASATMPGAHSSISSTLTPSKPTSSVQTPSKLAPSMPDSQLEPEFEGAYTPQSLERHHNLGDKLTEEPSLHYSHEELPIEISRSRSPDRESSPAASVSAIKEPRFEPRFSHPLIPSAHVSRYYPSGPTTTFNSYPRSRMSLHRRELTTIGPSSLHQDVTTVGGYIGLKAVKGLLRKT